MNKTKRRIFNTAIKMFSEKGYDNTSVEEITAIAGVAKGSLYYHFSKKEDIYIWFQGFGMITHCTEIKNVKEYLYTLLLPNLRITLPLSIFVIFVKLSNPLILKMIGLVSSIIILGAINDLVTIVYIIRNRKQIEYLQLSGKYMYYKKK